MIALARNPRWVLVCCALAAVLGCAERVSACATCFGDPNSRMSVGVVWGVLVLVGIVVSVLTAFTGVSIFWMKRARRLSELDRESLGLM